MFPGVKDTDAAAQALGAWAAAAARPRRLLPWGDASISTATSRPPKTEHDKIMETARKWVAQTFYGTMLKQMRRKPVQVARFSGGRGGQAFSSLLDQHLADHMSRGPGRSW